MYPQGDCGHEGSSPCVQLQLTHRVMYFSSREGLGWMSEMSSAQGFMANVAAEARGPQGRVWVLGGAMLLCMWHPRCGALSLLAFHIK